MAICEFVDGRVPSLVFRAQLERCGVMITGVLDRLIRRHESDNSTQFKDSSPPLVLSVGSTVSLAGALV